jgi:serine/threonine protein kinase
LSELAVSVDTKKLCLVCNLVSTGDSIKCRCAGEKVIIAAKPKNAAEIVPGFRLKREIGQGATGIIYQATRISTKESVAIKILRLSLANDLETVRRFKQEVELTSQLSSRHIVTVKEFGFIHDGRPYMVMDYIDGRCLASTVEKDGALSCHRALPIFIQVATGLAQAHEHGIMHRDIKLGNIMLMDNDGAPDFVKIVDFGIAKQWLNSSNSSGGFTLAGEAVGSPSYMSPEQCQGTMVDHRTDIYSLGCVMYETLTGRPVFTAQTAVGVMAKHVNEAPPPMGLPTSSTSAEIERTVFKAMAKNPQDRYATANDLKSDMQFSLYALSQANPAPAGAPDGKRNIIGFGSIVREENSAAGN